MDLFDSFSNKLISDHRTKKLFTVYLKHILMIVIVPLLILILIILLQFYNSYKEKVSNYIYSAAKEKANYTDNILFQIDTYYKHCIADDDFYKLLSGSYLMNNFSGNDVPIRKVSESVNILKEYAQCISSVYLYNKYDNYVYGLYGSSSSDFDTFEDKEWYYKYESTGCSDYIAQLTDSTGSYITFCYNINYSSDKSGILTIKIRDTDFFGINEEQDQDKYAVKIKTTSDEIFAQYSHLGGKSFSEYSIPLNHFPGFLVYIVPKSSFSFLNQTHFPLIILFVFTAIALTVFLSLVISRKQYESILSVISAIESPYIGNTSDKSDPLYEVMDSDINSAQISNNIEKELINKITNLKKVQLIALQTQINPHFLFNTLNMISYSIIVNNAEDTEAVHMISLLSDILQHSLKSEEYIIPMAEELEVLKSYTSILELRHGHTFDIVYDVASQALSAKTLKSILQPLVENSIKHGIKPLNKKRRGLIKIKISTENNLLVMTVTDNGVGMTKEKFEELNSKLRSNIIFKNKSIGLNNVVSRVKLLFGDNGGFKIESDENQTSITIYHPIIKSDRNVTDKT